jgi:hypothetical protein
VNGIEIPIVQIAGITLLTDSRPLRIVIFVLIEHSLLAGFRNRPFVVTDTVSGTTGLLGLWAPEQPRRHRASWNGALRRDHLSSRAPVRFDVAGGAALTLRSNPAIRTHTSSNSP